MAIGRTDEWRQSSEDQRPYQGPALKPLPLELVFTEWCIRRVGIDYHVDIERHYYSVPHQFAKEQVEARLTARTVEIFIKGERVAAYMRGSGNGKHTTVTEHMPSSHRRYAGWTIDRIRRDALIIGTSAAALCDRILEERSHPEQGFRACLGIVRLVKAFGPERLAAAAKRALEIGARTFGSVNPSSTTTLIARPHQNGARTVWRSSTATSLAHVILIERIIIVLTHPSYDQLNQLGLFGMAKAFVDTEIRRKPACLLTRNGWRSCLAKRWPIAATRNLLPG
jgi:hypothetical protein